MHINFKFQNPNVITVSFEFGHEKPVSAEDYSYQRASESLIYLSIKSDDFMVFRIETSASVEFKKNCSFILWNFKIGQNTELERFGIVVLSCRKMGWYRRF